MRKRRRLLDGTAAERSIFDLAYDMTLSVMRMCATSRTLAEAVQAFARVFLYEHFSIDRFAVFSVVSRSNGPMFVLGVGDEPHSVHLGLFSGMRDRQIRHHPTARFGYDLFIRHGDYVFCFDDTSKRRSFDRHDVSLLWRFASVAKMMIAVAPARTCSSDEPGALLGRIDGDRMLHRMSKDRQSVVVGFVSPDAMNRTNESLGYAKGEKAFRHVVSLAQAVVHENGGEIARFSQDDILFVFPYCENVDKLMYDLCRSIRHKPLVIGERKIAMKASIGYTIIVKFGGSRVFSNAKHRASLALRAAQDAGGNQPIRQD